MTSEEFTLSINDLSTREREELYYFATSQLPINKISKKLRLLVLKKDSHLENVRDEILAIISDSTIIEDFTERSLEPDKFFSDDELLKEIIQLEAEIALTFERTIDRYLRLGEMFYAVKEKLEYLHGVEVGVISGRFGREKSPFKEWYIGKGYNKNLVSDSMKKYRLYKEHDGHPKLQKLIKELGIRTVRLLTLEKFKRDKHLITNTLDMIHNNEFNNYDGIEQYLLGRKYKANEVDRLLQEVKRNIKHYTSQDKDVLFSNLDAIREQLDSIKELHRLNTTVPTFNISEE